LDLENTMKFFLRTTIVLALYVSSAFGQTVAQQWTITTTFESTANAYPFFDQNGNPYPCTGQNPDNPADSNPNCFNPLVLTTNWTENQVLGVVTGVTPDVVHTLTNSSCEAQDTVANITASGTDILGIYQFTITVTLDNGATMTFSGHLSTSTSQFTGTFTSTGTCMNSDAGNFTANLIPQVNATYAGEFETSSGGQGVSITIATDSNFNVTGAVTPANNAATCFSNITIATPLANSYSPSYASGDVLVAVGSDDLGNVVGFIGSNTNGNGGILPSNGLYFTYVGLAGSCAGIIEVDAPFQVVASRPPHYPRIGGRTWLRRTETPNITSDHELDRENTKADRSDWR
jgi:hypothetical protein